MIEIRDRPMAIGEELAANVLGKFCNWYGNEKTLQTNIYNALRLVSKGQNVEAIKLIPEDSRNRVRGLLAESISRFESWPAWYVNSSITVFRPFYGKEVVDIENYKKLLKIL